MEIAKLRADNRQAAGSRAARRLRKAGKLPGILYGHQQAPQPVVVDAHDLNLLLEHGAHLVELDLDGSTQAALIKDVQYAHLGTEPVHVDFVRVARDERVTVSVPLEFKGTPVGVNEGGVLEHDMVDIEIECLATEIPDSIRVMITDLRLGQSLHVRDLQLPPNVTAVSPPEAIVCSVRTKKAEVEAPEAEGEEAAEPEIITRKKEETETEE
ncbi:MAG TPA: 50S ribosomal protein L25 [Phycisphaerae bacterium]|nr:50S ribosomal protein L25 [Phycisphaerae bacterium]HOJ75787.1 50S ribosomal protein L25 [Phycisphaerae bacterium]HOM51454.1 50S ribosomal protein L25 [Phycisphaerae bacterium]HON66944.1 50S ribosomal protein L25 [Phycisphaerae bacterium]HOQ86540.1 50S ribosomal protein L25 [Phycisphaerae bacterium]